jgi:hypothetical protein
MDKTIACIKSMLSSIQGIFRSGCSLQKLQQAAIPHMGTVTRDNQKGGCIVGGCIVNHQVWEIWYKRPVKKAEEAGE